MLHFPFFKFFFHSHLFSRDLSMPFYVSFRAMLRCLCLVTSMKWLQRLLGISPVHSYSCWLGDCFYLSYLASVSVPKKKNEKKNLLWSSTHPVAVNLDVKAHWGPQERLTDCLWWTLRADSTYVFWKFYGIIALIFHSLCKVNSGSKNAPVFWRKKKDNSNWIINAALYNCYKYICLNFSC